MLSDKNGSFLLTSFDNSILGVKLSFAKNSEAARIKIGLLTRKFTLTTGELRQEDESEIVQSSKLNSKRFHFARINIDKPTFPTFPVSDADTYVIIDSSKIPEDSGQTTLPYFDGMPVVSDPPAPLGGFGIFHKTAADFTGVVSLRLISLNYTYYVENSPIDDIFKGVSAFKEARVPAEEPIVYEAEDTSSAQADEAIVVENSDIALREDEVSFAEGSLLPAEYQMYSTY